MDWDDVKPKPAKALSVGEDLSSHSIAELEARVLALDAEIQRTRGEIATKKARASAAADLFKR